MDSMKYQAANIEILDFSAASFVIKIQYQGEKLGNVTFR